MLLQKGNPRRRRGALTAVASRGEAAAQSAGARGGHASGLARPRVLDVRAIDLSHNGIRDEDTVLAGALRNNRDQQPQPRGTSSAAVRGWQRSRRASAPRRWLADLSQNRIATKEAGTRLARRCLTTGP